MADRQHLLVVVPGIGGSVLAQPGRSDDVVWDAGKCNIADLVLRPDRMSLDETPNLKPIGLTRSTKFLGFTVVPGYERLLKQLESFGRVDRRGDPQHPLPDADVVAVPYDFRRNIREAAERLDAVVHAHLVDLSQAERASRVIVVAHSMGGLVARVWLGLLERWPWCRALITLGTPHRGAPKALDLLVNGVRLLGCELSRPTQLLRGWPSMVQLVPRYRAIMNVGTAAALYPHELPIEDLAESARVAFDLHEEIERSWQSMPRHGPEMVPCIGWCHKTPDAAFWDGVHLRVTKTQPYWLDLVGWQRDFGDGTVPAVSALPIEMDNHIGSPIRLLDRHIPMACSPQIIKLLNDYESRRPPRQVRGEEDSEHRPAIGLDLDELHAAGEPIPLDVTLREVDADVSGEAVWAILRPHDDESAEPVDAKLRWDSERRCFHGVLPGQAQGLYDVEVVAQEVPKAGDLHSFDTVAVVAGE